MQSVRKVAHAELKVDVRDSEIVACTAPAEQGAYLIQPPPSVRSPATHQPPHFLEFARQMRSTTTANIFTNGRPLSHPTFRLDSPVLNGDGNTPRSFRCTEERRGLRTKPGPDSARFRALA